MKKWRDNAKKKELDFSFAPDDDESEQTLYEIVEQVLFEYELNETVSLLELAVWKFACLTSQPIGPYRDHIDSLLWLSYGWKAKKREMRLTNDIATVVTRVLPFLK